MEKLIKINARRLSEGGLMKIHQAASVVGKRHPQSTLVDLLRHISQLEADIKKLKGQ